MNTPNPYDGNPHLDENDNRCEDPFRGSYSNRILGYAQNTDRDIQG